MRSSPDGRIWAVVLAGGIGSRFWPASTPTRPKQLLRLASERPLIEETVRRIRPLVPLERLRILTSAELADPIQRFLPDLGTDNFLLEPTAAGTAPVLVWAATRIAEIDPQAIMVSLHADHVIKPPERFRDRISAAAALARQHGRLFTIGAVPDRPETGYGYIRVGKPLAPNASFPTCQAFEVARFVEKPNAATAAAYLAEGGHLWNTGIFVWTVRDFLDQIRRHTPEIASLIPLLDAGDPGAFFNRVPTVSIDDALLERSDRIAVLPADFSWDDVGSWTAVFRTQPQDDGGNVLVGDALPVDTRGCVIYADDGPVVAFGARDLVIVRTSGVTFVCHRDRCDDLKDLLKRLPEELRRLETR